MVGTVTYAAVQESEKKAAIAVTFTDGTSRILMQPMTDAEFADDKVHPDAYFGDTSTSKKAEDQYDLFEFFMSEQGIVARDAFAASPQTGRFRSAGGRQRHGFARRILRGARRRRA